MSAQRLDALPYDVKDIILSLVDSTKDLLHLGVSNKEWKALVIPHHIEYRVLRLKCHHSHPEVWNHLAQNRHLASRIRVVELEPDHVHADNADAHSTHSASKSPLCLYPKSLLGEPLVPRSGRADAKQDILHAFWNMTALTSFSWTTACCSGAGTFSSPLNADPTVIKEILNCLKGLQSLRKLLVCDSGGKVLACEDAREEHEAGHWLRGFHNIEELSASTRDPSLGVGIKSQEPMCNLRRLCIQTCGDYDPSSEAFLSYTFPNLVSIDIAVPPSRQAESWTRPVIDFLARHPSIEALDWQTGSWVAGRLRLPKGFLPNLKFLRAWNTFLLAVLGSKVDGSRRRPLKELHGLWLNDDSFAMLRREQSALSSVRCVSVDHIYNHQLLLALGRIIPSVEVLTLCPSNPPVYKLADFVAIISRFHSLQKLPGAAVLCRTEDKTILAGRVLQARPTLQGFTTLCEHDQSFYVHLHPERWENMERPVAHSNGLGPVPKA